MTAEIKLWRAVLLTAANDAILDIYKDDKKDATWHYHLSRTRNCRMICEFAQVDWDAVKEGFARIYHRVRK